jgi:hypothetical protein
MADRYTKGMAEKAFEILAKRCNKEIGHYDKNYEPKPGAWELNYAPEYGGFIIEELDNRGGVNHPFGEGRKSAKEFVKCVNFFLEGCYSLYGV